jgi:hypothetical protein
MRGGTSNLPPICNPNFSFMRGGTSTTLSHLFCNPSFSFMRGGTSNLPPICNPNFSFMGWGRKKRKKK